MQAPYEASGPGSRPEMLSAVASYVQREYGESYRIAPALTSRRVTIFEVVAGDGSRFNLVADCWGNVKRAEPETQESVKRLAEDMAMEAKAL